MVYKRETAEVVQTAVLVRSRALVAMVETRKVGVEASTYRVTLPLGLRNQGRVASRTL